VIVSTVIALAGKGILLPSLLNNPAGASQRHIKSFQSKFSRGPRGLRADKAVPNQLLKCGWRAVNIAEIEHLIMLVNKEVGRVQVYYLDICQSDAVMIAEIDHSIVAIRHLEQGLQMAGLRVI
jgi:hypothetical protein